MAHHVLEGDWETVLKTDVATYLLGERKNDEPICIFKFHPFRIPSCHQEWNEWIDSVLTESNTSLYQLCRYEE